MKIVSSFLLLAVLATASPLRAQDGTAVEQGGRRLSVNVFRAPSTGLDYRVSGGTSLHAGFYPTVIRIRGERERVNFRPSARRLP